MNSRILSLLEMNQVVVIYTKNSRYPELARICEITKHISVQKNSKTEYISYSYSFRPYNYEKNPFQNFRDSDTNFLTWEEIDGFHTLEDFKEYFNYIMKDAFEIKLKLDI